MQEFGQRYFKMEKKIITITIMEKKIITITIGILLMISLVIAGISISSIAISKDDATTIKNYLTSKNLTAIINPVLSDAVCNEYECIVCPNQRGVKLDCFGINRYKYDGEGTEVIKGDEKTISELRTEADKEILKQLESFAEELREVKEDKEVGGNITITEGISIDK